MAEGYANSSYKWPTMNWAAADLSKEWERFYQHCEFTFGGPLSKCTEKEKICNLMSFVGDKGREIYLTFQWETVRVGTGESAQDVNERDILERVVGKFKAHLEAKKNPIMAAVKFDRRRQLQGETFDSFVTDLKLLARGLDMTESNKLIRNAIACKSLDERVRQRCLEKSKHLTLEMAIDIGRMFEATKDGMQVMSGEDPKVEVNKLAWKGGSSKKPKNKVPKEKNVQVPKCDRCGYNAHKPHEKCPARKESCNKCKKIGHFANVCRSKKSNVNLLNEMDYPGEGYSSDEEGPESDVQLLHVASLEMNGIRDKTKTSESDEWWAVVEVGNSTLHCQLDTGAYASVINITHLKQVAPRALIKQTKKTLVSYSQHRITPKGYVTLPVRFKDRELNVNFYVIDSEQKPILSGEVCQALNLVQRVHNLQEHVDQSLKELLNQYPDLLSASGAMPGTYSIKIDPKATPVVHGPRRQPAALLPKITAKLKEMEKEGHLAKVSQPTDWVNSMVVSSRGEKIRICLDPGDLNKAVKREHYPIPTVEEIAAKIPEAKVFTVLDAKSGYLQMKLDYESSLLTTMNTPIGRYRWLKLPFGIKSAPELYQRAMDEMLEDIDHAYAIMDDILIAGRDIAHHDSVLNEVLHRARTYNLKLNFEKVKVRKQQVPYVGHIISAEGLKPDPEKVRAMKDMPPPETKEDVRRFLGSIQYLAKFLPMLAEVETPLRELTRKDVLFHWDKPQAAAFQKLKDMCCEAPLLAYYDVRKDVTIQCDASNSAVGAVLLQEGRPIAYASRKLRPSELNWAPIEKEMLAIVFSTQKFREYILGKTTLVQTDHKPLEMILRKPLTTAPLRLQAMMLRVSGYDLSVEYLPGKKQVLADTLSRASLNEVPPEEEEIQVNMLERISVSEPKYAELQQNTANELHELYAMIQAGWPDTKQQVPHSIRQYWDTRDELAVLDGVIYRGMRIVVPPSMRPAMLEIIHGTHLGIVKCKQRAREALYWPGMSGQIEDKVKDCTTCHDYAPAQQKEPLMPSPVPDLPWERAASDIFAFEGEHYLLLVDYFSKFIEVTKLKDLTSLETIEVLKEHFSRHGIPAKLVTDCGSQYTSSEFETFAKSYTFEHVLVNPKYPKANGEAEAAVKTVKSIWRKNKDKRKALLEYRASPLPAIDLSPSQLSMGRRLRTTLPIAHGLLEPETHSTQKIRARMKHGKDKQKYYHDRQGTKELPPLRTGDHVRVRPEPGSKEWRAATVVQKHALPRSYVVEVSGRRIRRNRVALRNDSAKSHMEYRKRHGNIAQQTEPEPDKTHAAPTSPASPQVDPTAQEYHLNPSPAEEMPAGGVPPPVDIAEAKDPPFYKTRSGRQVRKPVRLDL